VSPTDDDDTEVAVDEAQIDETEEHDDIEPEVADPHQGVREALADAGFDIGHRDVDAETSARDVLTEDGATRARLGHLAQWAITLSGVQATWPPRPFAAARVLLVGEPAAADHPVHALAADAGVTIRSIDAPDDLAEAVRAGAAEVDAAVDGGADLLILSTVDHEVTASTLIALLLRLSAVEVVGDAPQLDEAAWADRVARIRDLSHAARARESDPAALLTSVGDPVLATLAGMHLRASARRTPVLLDGLAGHAAALLANRVGVLASWWWFAASTSQHAGQRRALDGLGLQPLLDTDSGLDGGAAALMALPLLGATQRIVAACAAQASADKARRALAMDIDEAT
jgi:NaMN:DMB phosphoribosyltransferase